MENQLRGPQGPKSSGSDLSGEGIGDAPLPKPGGKPVKPAANRNKGSRVNKGRKRNKKALTARGAVESVQRLAGELDAMRQTRAESGRRHGGKSARDDTDPRPVRPHPAPAQLDEVSSLSNEEEEQEIRRPPPVKLADKPIPAAVGDLGAPVAPNPDDDIRIDIPVDGPDGDVSDPSTPGQLPMRLRVARMIAEGESWELAWWQPFVISPRRKLAVCVALCLLLASYALSFLGRNHLSDWAFAMSVVVGVYLVSTLCSVPSMVRVTPTSFGNNIDVDGRPDANSLMDMKHQCCMVWCRLLQRKTSNRGWFRVFSTRRSTILVDIESVTQLCSAGVTCVPAENLALNIMSTQKRLHTVNLDRSYILDEQDVPANNTFLAKLLILIARKEAMLDFQPVLQKW